MVSIGYSAYSLPRLGAVYMGGGMGRLPGRDV